MNEIVTQDAKALYKKLDELIEALGHLGIEGEIGHVEDYDQVKYEAEILLQALDGDYADD